MADAGGAQALTLQNGVENVALGEAGQPRGGLADFLKRLFLGLGLQRRQNAFGFEEIAQIHGNALNFRASPAALPQRQAIVRTTAPTAAPAFPP